MWYVVISDGRQAKFANIFSALHALDQISYDGNYAACLYDWQGRLYDKVGCGKVGE